MVLFAAATGMRPGEWIALEQRDIDREARVAYVRRAFSKGTLRCTKTEASVRLEDSEPNAEERMWAWRRDVDEPYGDTEDDARTAIVSDYLTRHIKLERERPAAHIEEAERKELTRRLLYKDEAAEEFAVELALNEPDRGAQEIGDYVAAIMTVSQRCRILPLGGVDDCWTLADEFAEAINNARAAGVTDVSQIST